MIPISQLCGKEKLKGLLSSFDYESLLNFIIDVENLKILYNKAQGGYEKLQIFRIINGEFTNGDDFSDVMKKFINETYHIENDFIHQLDPREYNLIPEFIVE